MNKEICILEYLAKQIDSGIKEVKLEQDIRPVQARCYCCNEGMRCQFYIPLKRVQNIRDGDKLYRRNYRKYP